eukprot:Clim_evm10s35 gene=Clim_evmTU10s35
MIRTAVKTNRRMARDAFKAALKSHVKGVVFDMDGTLTIPAIDFDKMRRLTNVPTGKPILETVMGFEPEERDRCLQVIEDVETEALEHLKLMDGTVELLSWLKDDLRYPVGLVTRNNRFAVDAFLNKVGRHDVFVEILTRDFKPCKPNPAALHHLADIVMQVDTEHLLMVGDHPDDITCGLSANSLTCMIRQDYNTQHDSMAHYFAAGLVELHDIMQEAWQQPIKQQ